MSDGPNFHNVASGLGTVSSCKANIYGPRVSSLLSLVFCVRYMRSHMGVHTIFGNDLERALKCMFYTTCTNRSVVYD